MREPKVRKGKKLTTKEILKKVKHMRKVELRDDRRYLFMLDSNHFSETEMRDLSRVLFESGSRVLVWLVNSFEGIRIVEGVGGELDEKSAQKGIK